MVKSHNFNIKLKEQVRWTYITYICHGQGFAYAYEALSLRLRRVLYLKEPMQGYHINMHKYLRTIQSNLHKTKCHVYIYSPYNPPEPLQNQYHAYTFFVQSGRTSTKYLKASTDYTCLAFPYHLSLFFSVSGFGVNLFIVHFSGPRVIRSFRI